MQNNANEGYPGYTIGVVDQYAATSGAWDYVPNVVLLFAGTNDCAATHRSHISHTPHDMDVMLQHIRQRSPNALTVVAGVIHNLDDTWDSCIKGLDDDWAIAVRNAASKGQKVTFTNMYDTVPKSEIHKSDGTHPTDAGFALIANAWYKALILAGDRITSPDPKGKSPPPDRHVKEGHAR
ncbi:carbohydrate esterase family 3 protein [Myriangium duriaei CBS 260.36]|uniref:Carbohydrate esterase family 3 protein n=1 Tax=Myriangium duriaei CBS 260.36 TaxID=1168546 RepID=A0A9P4J194_9PEZI|nr:carbohydrate esterase family 3 protein [Myriangium duriaei CBS 260.36]